MELDEVVNFGDLDLEPTSPLALTSFVTMLLPTPQLASWYSRSVDGEAPTGLVPFAQILNNNADTLYVHVHLR